MSTGEPERRGQCPGALRDATSVDAPPGIGGVLETALYVSDLARSERFYARVFGFATRFADERMRALRMPQRQVLLLFLEGGSEQPVPTEGGVIPPHGGSGRQHLAFKIRAEALPRWEQWLQRCGVVIESRVDWPEGGTSLFFRDPDEHCLELVSPGCWQDTY